MTAVSPVIAIIPPPRQAKPCTDLVAQSRDARALDQQRRSARGPDQRDDLPDHRTTSFAEYQQGFYASSMG